MQREQQQLLQQQPGSCGWDQGLQSLNCPDSELVFRICEAKVLCVSVPLATPFTKLVDSVSTTTKAAAAGAAAAAAPAA